MKRFKQMFLAAGMSLALFSSPLLLADDAADKGGSDKGMMHEHGEMGARMIDKMKDKLGLSDDQVAKVKEAAKANHEAMKPIMEKMRKDMESLKDLVAKK